MLTQLYTTEEDPALCSIIWGSNFTITPVIQDNDSQAITAASTSHHVIAVASDASGSGDNGGLNVIAGGGAGGAAAVGSVVTNNAAGSLGVGDNLRDDLYITNEVSICFCHLTYA